LTLQQAVDLLTECGDLRGQVIALCTLASMLRRHAHLTQALAVFGEALGYYTASADWLGRCQTLRFIGQTHLDLGQYDQARQELEVAETVAANDLDERLIAQACLALGDIGGAQVAFDAVFDVFGDTSGGGHAYARHGPGQVATRRGAYNVADRHLSEATALAHDTADTRLEGRIWLLVADLRHAQGRLDEQAETLRAAVALLHDGGEVSLEVQALAELAQAMAERGDTTAAEEAWTRIENLYAAADLPDEDRIHSRS
jgi:tetratricopeptide (TPR) repeat protein